MKYKTPTHTQKSGKKKHTRRMTWLHIQQQESSHCNHKSLRRHLPLSTRSRANPGLDRESCDGSGMRHPGLRPKGHLTGLGFRRFHAPNAILELHNRLTQQAHRKSSTFPTAKPRPLAPQDKIEPKISKPQWAHVPACRCQPCQPCQPYKYVMKTSQQ